MRVNDRPAEVRNRRKATVKIRTNTAPGFIPLDPTFFKKSFREDIGGI